MSKIRLRLLMLASLLVSGPLGASDELVLRSGKIIHGKITAEDEDSYTVKLGSNMSLNVSKSDVSRVMREPPPEPPKPRHPAKPKKIEAAAPAAPVPVSAAPVPATAVPVKKKPTLPHHKKETVPAPVAPVPAAPLAPAEPPPAPPAPVDQRVPKSEDDGATGASGPVTVSPDLPSVSKKIGVVTLNQSAMKAFYPVKGSTYEQAMKTITHSATGKGFLVRGARRPSRTQWRLSWYGTPAQGGTAWATLTVNTTITTTLPAWEPRRPPPVTETRKWDAMIKESEDIESAHVRIIGEALAFFASETSNLTAANEQELRVETGKILSDARSRSDNRRKGYDRRRTEMKRIIRKKTVHK